MLFNGNSFLGVICQSLLLSYFCSCQTIIFNKSSSAYWSTEVKSVVCVLKFITMSAYYTNNRNDWRHFVNDLRHFIMSNSNNGELGNTSHSSTWMGEWLGPLVAMGGIWTTLEGWWDFDAVKVRSHLSGKERVNKPDERSLWTSL